MREQADLAVEAFEAAVGEAEAEGGEDPCFVAADGAGELDGRLELGARRPGPPGGQVLRGERRVDLVEQPELVVEQGAVEAPAVVLDFGEAGELTDRLALGRS